MTHKLLILIPLIILGLNCNATIVSSYQIIEEKYDRNIPKDTTLIFGSVYDGKKPLENVKIRTCGIRPVQKDKTTNKGKFWLYIDSEDNAIYCKKAGYEEVIITDYDFKSQHSVYIKFFLVETEANTEGDYPHKRYPPPTAGRARCYKPVIYLYPEKETKIEVDLAIKGDLTFTYPKYNNGWSITALPDGTLKSDNGRTYPYLFWEGESDSINFVRKNEQLEGFLIKTDTIISFLEHQLETIGLNHREQTDFITFWGPRLESKKYALIQFLIDQEYDNIATLKVSPQPSSVKRVYLLYTSLDHPNYNIKLSEPNFSSFDRKGFTLIEWGGSEISRLVMENTLVYSQSGVK